MSYTWPTKPLGELATVVRGVSFDRSEVSNEPRPQTVPILRAGNIQDSLITNADLVYVRDTLVKDEQHMRRGDLAICMSSGSPQVVGKSAYLATDWLGSIGAFCGIVRFNDKLNHRFGSYWFRSPEFFSWRNSNAKGANIQNLRHAELEKLQLPAPPLPEQERIVKLLDAAEELRRLRAAADRRTADLIPALFHDMFGDPTINPLRLPVAELDDFLSFVTSGSRGWADYYVPVGARFIRSLDVRMNGISDEDAVFVNPPNGAEADRTRVKSGDVLLTITGSRIGRVASVPERLNGAFISQHVAILRLKAGLLPEFISMFLSLNAGGQREIARVHYGQTKPGLNLDQIRKFRVPVPPIAQQRVFAARVAEIRVLETQQAASRCRLGDLFQSMLRRAFQGEL